MPGRYFEDFRIGEHYVTASRTVTEADVVNFAGLSGDFYPLHMDERYARTTAFKGRIAHGLCGLSIASGLVIQTGIFDCTLMAFSEMDWKFIKPVRIGDTLTVRLEVREKKESRRKDRGGILLFVTVTNQKGEGVQEGHWRLILSRRPGRE